MLDSKVLWSKSPHHALQACSTKCSISKEGCSHFSSLDLVSVMTIDNNLKHLGSS
jgi:hypothetical protein